MFSRSCFCSQTYGLRTSILYLPQSRNQATLVGTDTAASRNLKQVTQDGLRIEPSRLSFYWDTKPPTQRELSFARTFFRTVNPEASFSATRFHLVKQTELPEVAFLGRSNVGKSSLLNALFGIMVARISNNPGMTRALNAYSVGGADSMGNRGRINVLDTPGYGKGSRSEWGKEITKYLLQRRELRRAFLLIDAVHGLKTSDLQILELFRRNAIPHQIILSKVDRFLLSSDGKRTSAAFLEDRLEELKHHVEALKPNIQPSGDGVPALGEVLTCSGVRRKTARKKLALVEGMANLDAIRWAILAATGAVPGKKIKARVSQLLSPTKVLVE